MEHRETKVHNKRPTTRIIKKGLATLLLTGISKVNSQYGFYSRPTTTSYPYKLAGKVVGENYNSNDIINYGHVLQMANGDKIAVAFIFDSPKTRIQRFFYQANNGLVDISFEDDPILTSASPSLQDMHTLSWKK